jgi:hypothetical protein
MKQRSCPPEISQRRGQSEAIPLKKTNVSQCVLCQLQKRRDRRGLTAWEKGKFLGKGYSNHHTQEDKHIRDDREGGLVGGWPRAQCAATQNRGLGESSKALVPG